MNVYLLDDLQKDAASIMADIYDFLGVDRSFKPVIEIYNRSAQMRLMWADRLLRSKAVLWLGRLLPTALRHRLRDLLLKDEKHEKFLAGSNPFRPLQAGTIYGYFVKEEESESG